MIVLLFLLACTPDVDAPVGEVLVVDVDRSEVAGKGLLMTVTEATGEAGYPMLIDGEGAVRWRRAGGGKALRVRASTPRGNDDTVLVIFDSTQGSPGKIQRETLDGRVLSVTSAPNAHHEVLELADGRLAWLEHIETISSLPTDANAPISSDVVMVGPEGGAGEPAFSFFDDYPAAPFWVCDHMKKGARIPGHYQWTHSNSLVQDPARPQELGLLSRNLDAFIWFDLATGAFLEQLGGVHSTIDFGGDDFDHPHMSHAPAPDRLLVFDNRLHTKEDSRVVEVSVDRDAGSAEVVWTYVHPDVGNIGFLGDARRLPGGNTLIAWSDDRRLTEVTPEGDVVWELRIEGIKFMGRVQLWNGTLP